MVFGMSYLIVIINTLNLFNSMTIHRIYIHFLFIIIGNTISAQSMGIKTASPQTVLDVNGSVAFREGTAINLTFSVNDDVTIDTMSFYRVTGATAAFSITGFTGGQSGRILTIINNTSYTMTLSHLTSSSAANQINTGMGTNVTITTGGTASFIYNSSISKWLTTAIMTNSGLSNWSTSGNAGTTAGTNFIGTTDAQDFVAKANTTEGIRLATSGNVGINTTLPNVKLDVDGGIAFRPLTSISVTTNNQAVTVGNYSFLRISSNGATSSRIITLSSGLQDGQLLFILVSALGLNGIQITDTATCNMAGNVSLQDGDTITLIWDNSAWHELARSNN